MSDSPRNRVQCMGSTALVVSSRGMGPHASLHAWGGHSGRTGMPAVGCGIVSNSIMSDCCHRGQSSIGLPFMLPSFFPSFSLPHIGTYFACVALCVAYGGCVTRGLGIGVARFGGEYGQYVSGIYISSYWICAYVCGVAVCKWQPAF